MMSVPGSTCAASETLLLRLICMYASGWSAYPTRTAYLTPSGASAWWPLTGAIAAWTIPQPFSRALRWISTVAACLMDSSTYGMALPLLFC